MWARNDVVRMKRRAPSAARPLKTLFEQKSSFEVPLGLPNRSARSASGASEDPVRAKKRARSASGASEKFKVSANEGASSEQERLRAAKTRAKPECPEAIFGIFEMDFSIFLPCWGARDLSRVKVSALNWAWTPKKCRKTKTRIF